MKEQISRRELLGRGLKASIALAMPAILTRKSRANLECEAGKLQIQNYVYDADFAQCVYNIVHGSIYGDTEGTEGFDNYKEGDRSYSGFFSPSGKSTKIVSLIPGYVLRVRYNRKLWMDR